MNEIDELIDLTNDLIQSYKDLDIYKRYLKLKEELNQNKELKKLKKKLDTLKEKLKNSSDKKEILIQIQETNNLYNSNPIVVNYNQTKNELLEILEPLISLDL